MIARSHAAVANVRSTPRLVGLAVEKASLELYLPGREVDGQPARRVVVMAGGAKSNQAYRASVGELA
jgi:hypothetical protein